MLVLSNTIGFDVVPFQIEAAFEGEVFGTELANNVVLIVFFENGQDSGSVVAEHAVDDVEVGLLDVHVGEPFNDFSVRHELGPDPFLVVLESQVVGLQLHAHVHVRHAVIGSIV